MIKITQWLITLILFLTLLLLFIPTRNCACLYDAGLAHIAYSRMFLFSWLLSLIPSLLLPLYFLPLFHTWIHVVGLFVFLRSCVAVLAILRSCVCVTQGCCVNITTMKTQRLISIMRAYSLSLFSLCCLLFSMCTLLYQDRSSWLANIFVLLGQLKLLRVGLQYSKGKGEVGI